MIFSCCRGCVYRKPQLSTINLLMGTSVHKVLFMDVDMRLKHNIAYMSVTRNQRVKTEKATRASCWVKMNMMMKNMKMLRREQSSPQTGPSLTLQAWCWRDLYRIILCYFQRPCKWTTTATRMILYWYIGSPCICENKCKYFFSKCIESGDREQIYPSNLNV